MLSLLAVSLIWAFSFGLIGNTLAGIDPWFLASARLGLSSLLFIPFIRLSGLKMKTMLELASIGALQYGMMYGMLFLGFKHLESHEVALFTILTPIYVTLVNDLFRKKFEAVFLASAVIAVAGTAVIKYEDISSGDILIGFGIIQISNLCFATGQIWYRNAMKRICDRQNREVFALLYIGATIVAAVFWLLMGDHGCMKEISLKQLKVILYLGLLASGLGFFLWNVGARKVNAGTLAVFNNLKIPLAISVSIIVFDEEVSIPRLLFGLALILVALLMDEHRAGRRINASLARQ